MATFTDDTPCPIGKKHFGKPFKDIPLKDLEWLEEHLRKGDWLTALRGYLNERKAKNDESKNIKA